MPKTIDMLLAAIEHQRAGRHGPAEALYRAVLAMEPGHAQALFLYGLLQLDSDQSHEAVATLQAAVAARPQHVGAQANLARALLADGDPAQATIAVDRLNKLDPQHAELDFLRGTALSARGETVLAIETLQRAVLRSPSHAAAWLNLGNACADLDRLEAAEQHCRTAIRLDYYRPECE
jgi:protein O-GlcNAc transferase